MELIILMTWSIWNTKNGIIFDNQIPSLNTALIRSRKVLNHVQSLFKKKSRLKASRPRVTRGDSGSFAPPPPSHLGPRSYRLRPLDGGKGTGFLLLVDRVIIESC
jgi:hypothetical protein